MTNPYDIPKRPHLTIKQVIVYASKAGEITLEDLVDEFGITSNDASVRLLKYYRWGYLTRWKEKLPPRIFRYKLTRFGKHAAKRWS